MFPHEAYIYDLYVLGFIDTCIEVLIKQCAIRLRASGSLWWCFAGLH